MNGKIIIFFIFGIILFSGCGTLKIDASDPMTEDLMFKALEAIRTDDEEGFKALFAEEMLPTGEEFSAAFSKLQSYYRGEVISFKAVSKNTHTNSGAKPSKTITCVYQVDTNVDKYFISAIRAEDGEMSLLYGLTVVLKDEYTEANTPGGFFGDITQFTNVQWILMLTNFIAYGFVAFTIVRCLRDKIRRKVLFVIVSLLQIVFTVTIGPNSFFVNLMVTPVGFARQLLYPTEGTVTAILIPLGALIYLGIRKRLIRHATEIPPKTNNDFST